MRTCPKCKKTIENDLALFCRYCGTKLPEVPKPEEKPEPVSAAPSPTPSPTEEKGSFPQASNNVVNESAPVTKNERQVAEPVGKSVPPPLPPLPNMGQAANVVKESDDEVTIIYTPSETPPPIPNFRPSPSPTEEGGDSPQAPKVVNKAPVSSYRKEKKGSAGTIIAVVFILLIILGIIAFGLYYNGVFGGRSSTSFEPDNEYFMDSVAVDTAYVDNDNDYDRDDVLDEVVAPDPVESYDNVDNVIERIGTDDDYDDFDD